MPKPPINLNEDSMMASTVTQGFSPLALLNLPGEVRNTIYHLVIESLPATFTPNTLVKFGRPAGEHNQVFREFLSLLLQNVSIMVSSTYSLWSLDAYLFLLTSSGDGKILIATLEFPRFWEMADSRSRANEIMDFCADCPNLSVITITLRLDHIHMPILRTAFTDNVPGRRLLPSKSPVQVARDYGFVKLLQNRRLKHVTVICELGDVSYDEEQALTFWGLRSWLVQAFATVNGTSKVNSTVVPSPPTAIGAFSLDIEQR